MPTYEFRCKKCQSVYEDFFRTFDDKVIAKQTKALKCPGCGSKSKKRLVSNCSFQFANPVGTDIWRESHDYRFEHNKPKVRAERAAAAAYKGTSGKANPTPYRKIDDISSGKHFGEVK
jgi:putative FmdB family regulatory protein